jgi:hypothetical protein
LAAGACITSQYDDASYSRNVQALRSIKGILNKLTPEKFERLLSQLLEVITTASLLQTTISLVSAFAAQRVAGWLAHFCPWLPRSLRVCAIVCCALSHHQSESQVQPCIRDGEEGGGSGGIGNTTGRSTPSQCAC